MGLGVLEAGSVDDTPGRRMPAVVGKGSEPEHGL